MPEQPASVENTRRLTEEGGAVSASTLEQYKVLWDTFNQEMQRFWFRFNILIGLELVAFFGFSTKLAEFRQNLEIFLVGLLMLAFFSWITVAIVWRAIQVYELLASLLLRFEEKAPKSCPLFLVTWAQEISNSDGGTSVDKPNAMYWGLGIAVLGAVGWSFWFFYVVSVELPAALHAKGESALPTFLGM